MFPPHSSLFDRLIRVRFIQLSADTTGTNKIMRNFKQIRIRMQRVFGPRAGVLADG